MRVIYGSVCSGIEAATVAWRELGWKPAWFSEIDRFPSALLKHHYPEVKNYGDFTTIGHDAGPIDLLCGGTPCQDFSVAGLRAGLAGARGNLTLEFVKLAGRLRPRWLVWENVPGVLSIDGGRAFGAFGGGLAELGYGFAYRILDAQHFGVPQRRRRVFVVGYLGDWRPAAAVLFESHCLSGYPPPSRETRESSTYGVAPSLTSSGRGVERCGESRGQDPVVACYLPELAYALNAHGGTGRNDAESETFIAPDIAGTLKSNSGGGGFGSDPSETFIACEIVDTLSVGANQTTGFIGDVVAHALRAEGFDASEDGTGRGVPLVPVAFDTTQVTSRENRSNLSPGDPCHPLTAGGHPPAIAFGWNKSSAQTMRIAEITDALQGSPTSNPAVAFTERGREQGRTFECQEEVAYCLTNPGSGGRTHSRQIITPSMAVRRLTPRECERLQGFPDDYTAIPYRKVSQKKLEADYLKYLMRGGMRTREECFQLAADGPRCKALGNSWAVPVPKWIGRRIQLVDSLLKGKE